MLLTAVFLLPALPNIKYLDACKDELVFGQFAINVLQGKQLDCWASVSIKLFGNSIPVDCYGIPMKHYRNFQFSLPSFIVLPFFGLFGISIYTFKMIFIFISYIGLIALFYALKKLFDSEFAFVTALFLSLSASFAYFSSFTLITDEHLIFIFLIFAVLSYMMYKQNNSFIYLFIAVIILGSCSSIKLSAFSYYFGGIVAGLIVYRRKIMEKYKEFNKVQLILLVMAFSAGAFMMLYYNFVTGGNTLKLVKYLFSNERTWAGISNMDLLEHIKLRVGHLFELLKDDGISKFYMVQIFREILFILFWAGFIFNLCVLYIHRNSNTKIIIFIYIFYLATFLTTFFSPGSMRFSHLALMQPLQQFVLALFVYNLYKISGSYKDNGSSVMKGVIRVSAVLIFVMIIAAKVNILMAYEAEIKRDTEHIGVIENSVERLAGYIKYNNLCPVTVVNNSLYGKIIIVTKGDVQQYYPLRFTVKKMFTEKMTSKAARNDKAYFVFEEIVPSLEFSRDISLPGKRPYDNIRQYLQDFARDKKMHFDTFGVVKSFDGTVIYTIYQLY